MRHAGAMFKYPVLVSPEGSEIISTSHQGLDHRLSETFAATASTGLQAHIYEKLRPISDENALTNSETVMTSSFLSVEGEGASLAKVHLPSSYRLLLIRVPLLPQLLGCLPCLFQQISVGGTPQMSHSSRPVRPCRG